MAEKLNTTFVNGKVKGNSGGGSAPLKACKKMGGKMKSGKC